VWRVRACARCGRGLKTPTVAQAYVACATTLSSRISSSLHAKIHILEACIFCPAWAPESFFTKTLTKSGYKVAGIALWAVPGGGVRALCEDDDLSAGADVPGASIASRHGVGFVPRKKKNAFFLQTHA
jgi:hypothetical protein